MSALAYYGGRLVDPDARAKWRTLGLTAAVVAALALSIVAFGGAATLQQAATTVGLATAAVTAMIAVASTYRPSRTAQAGFQDLPAAARPPVAFAMLTIVPIVVLILAVPVRIVALLRRLARRNARTSTRLRTFADGYYRRLSSWMWTALALASPFATLVVILDTPTSLTQGSLEVWHWEIFLLASPMLWTGAVLAGGGPRGRTILRQVGRGLLTLLVLSIVVFLLMAHRGAEDIAIQKFGNQITAEQIDAFASENGLDEPLYERYWNWLSNFVVGDMGTSYVTEESVAGDVIPRFKNTLTLAAVSLLIAIPISILLGVFQARRVGGWSDTTLLSTSTVLAALPEFVIAITLLFVFGVELGWLPIDSTALVFGSGIGAETVKAYILPVATLVLTTVPYIARIARASMREALGAPYTQAALLRGLSRPTVIWDHAMRNAAVPLVNVLAINIVYLVGGIVVIENVFAFPGVGQGIVQASQSSDLFKLEAYSIAMGAMFIIVSLLADMLVAYLNPRLRAAATT